MFEPILKIQSFFEDKVISFCYGVYKSLVQIYILRVLMQIGPHKQSRSIKKFELKVHLNKYIYENYNTNIRTFKYNCGNICLIR